MMTIAIHPCHEGRVILAQKSDEICYDLKEMEENILNVILSHYQDYKENLTINKKI